MANFYQLRDFEARFQEMDVAELRRWEQYWKRHAQGLSPKVRMQAMKRVHEIEKAIGQREAKPGRPDLVPLS